MLSLAFSRPPPPPLAPFHGQKHNSSILSISSRKPKTVSSVLFKPRNLNLSFASHSSFGELNDVGEEEAEKMRNIAILKESLKPELMPKHVALFTDGHRRWAKENNLSFELGYLAWATPFEQLFDLCRQLQIPVVSIFALASTNYSRPKEHINFFYKYLEVGLDYYVTKMFMRGDIRFSVIGNTATFPKSGQESIKRAEETTRNNKGLHIVCVANYNGRSDITQACKALAEKAKDGLIQPEEIDEKIFQQHLQTKSIDDYPDPDLFIRTGGKQRVSNYMLWQMAYSEMVFLDKYHPDMREADYVRIFSDFQKRGRRFGG